MVLVVAAELARWLLGFGADPASLALPFAVYALSVYDTTRARLVVLAVSIALIVFAVVLLSFNQLAVSRSLIPAGAISLVAFVIGDFVRSRRRFVLELVARHEREREAAAEAERLRIARELHDVVAHNVSVMAIQAGAARVSGSSPAETLQSIETTARATLAELNRLLGVLRKNPDAPLSPQPGLRQLEALLKPARDAGMEVSFRLEGAARQLSPALELSAYRIVQEAITNVLKHAHASRVEVKVEYEPDALALAITDNGVGQDERSDASAGHGLIGMRERVELFAGELATGPSPLGGFTVRARLPTS